MCSLNVIEGKENKRRRKQEYRIKKYNEKTTFSLTFRVI